MSSLQTNLLRSIRSLCLCHRQLLVTSQTVIMRLRRCCETAATSGALQRRRRQFTVSIEGNIGSGKSTMLAHFAKSSASLVEPVPEPLDKWCNLAGTNLLQKLYEDPARWFFSFNLYCMLTRLEMHRLETDKPVRMLERSLHSARHCFIESAAASNNLHPAELSVLDAYYRCLASSPQSPQSPRSPRIAASDDLKVDLYVYLRCPPAVCHERVARRCRPEEAPMPMELLERLHRLHDDWLLGPRLGAPVLVLDAGRGLTEMQQTWRDRSRDILCGCSAEEEEVDEAGGLN